MLETIAESASELVSIPPVSLEFPPFNNSKPRFLFGTTTYDEVREVAIDLLERIREGVQEDEIAVVTPDQTYMQGD